MMVTCVNNLAHTLSVNLLHCVVFEVLIILHDRLEILSLCGDRVTYQFMTSCRV
jgi:hypothetical protein